MVGNTSPSRVSADLAADRSPMAANGAKKTGRSRLISPSRSGVLGGPVWAVYSYPLDGTKGLRGGSAVSADPRKQRRRSLTPITASPISRFSGASSPPRPTSGVSLSEYCGVLRWCAARPCQRGGKSNQEVGVGRFRPARRRRGQTLLTPRIPDRGRAARLGAQLALPSSAMKA
jgi:hypothetical protein